MKPKRYRCRFGRPQEKLLVELKRKREKTRAELKDARAGKRDADKRCRLMEEEKEAICDDYEGRLQQQVQQYVPLRSGI